MKPFAARPLDLSRAFSRPVTSVALLAVLAAGCASLSEGVGWLRRTFHDITRWPEGHVMREGEVVEGEQQGDWVYFHKSGEKKTEGNFVEDRQEGIWTQWYENGNEEWRGAFLSGRRSGLWRYGHPSGTPRAQGRFEEGRETGEWTFWSTQGRLSQRGDFDGGKLTLRWTYWHPDGAKKAEGYYLEGAKVGLWRYWDGNGALSEKVHPLPTGWAIARENWENGAPRREGFLFEGRPAGRWVTWHANGTRRTTGNFTAGEADGNWMLHTETGELLAEGPLVAGRPKGVWSIATEQGTESWEADGMAPLPPLTGEWSGGDVGERRIQDVVGMWIAEATSALPSDSRVALNPQTDATPDPGLERETETKPKVPIRSQPWTWREEQSLDTYLENYGLDAKPPGKRRTSGRYGPRTAKGSSAPRGDTKRSDPLLGKPLPKQSFTAAEGGTLDLEQYRGKKLVVVLLRGFAGQVCVYCATQTRALVPAYPKFEAQGAEVLVVYPGPESGMDAFLEAYADTFGEDDLPPYRLLYDPELDMARKLGLAGDLAIPSTLILDEDGIVRWAYVGENIEDRPSAKQILDALVELNEPQ